MKKIILVCISTLYLLSACNSKDEVGYYFSDSERDTLLVNIISIISERPAYATDSTKHQAKFRSEFVSRLSRFHFVKLSKDSLGRYTYLISRPVLAELICVVEFWELLH